jgi:hypothetical protein
VFFLPRIDPLFGEHYFRTRYNGGWPTPMTISEVISFMRLVGYYRRFIEGFSKIVHPITSLQKKGIKFEWITKSEENFILLKELLTSAPILKIVDPNENFVVCTDSCK